MTVMTPSATQGGARFFLQHGAEHGYGRGLNGYVLLPGSYFLVSGAAMLAGFPFVIALLRAPFPWVWVFLFAACFCLFFNTGPTNTILANVTHPSIWATGFAVKIFVHEDPNWGNDSIDLLRARLV